MHIGRHMLPRLYLCGKLLFGQQLYARTDLQLYWAMSYRCALVLRWAFNVRRDFVPEQLLGDESVRQQ